MTAGSMPGLVLLRRADVEPVDGPFTLVRPAGFIVADPARPRPVGSTRPAEEALAGE